MPAKKGTAPPVRVPRRPTPTDRIPVRVPSPTLDDHLEIMSRAVFQAGLSWAFIDARWPAFVTAFDAFRVDRVAAYGDADIERLMTADGVVHSRGKIEGTIRNARTLLALRDEFGSLEAYAAGFPGYDELYADAHERFAYLGELSAYYWFFRTGIPVPRLEQWMARQPKDHPRIREMVELGRATGTSSER